MESVRSQMGPFAMVPRWLSRSSVSDGALRLYVALADRADRNTDVARFSRAQLAEDMGGVTEKTVTRRVAELEALGAIVVTRVKDEQGSNEVNEYLVMQAPKPTPPRDTDVPTPRDTDVPPLGTQMSLPQGHRCPAKKNHLEEPSTRTPQHSDSQGESDADGGVSMVLTELFLGHVRGVPGVQKRIDVAKWQKVIGQMLRLDGVDPADLAEFIEWLYTDTESAKAEFWQTNVRSARTLREKYPVIQEQRRVERLRQERNRAQRAEMDARYGVKPHTSPADSKHPANKVMGRLPRWFWDQSFKTLADLELEASNYGVGLDEALALGGKSRSDFVA